MLLEIYKIFKNCPHQKVLKKHFLYFLYFLMYYLCEKYKPVTVQHYISDCVSWVPRLTLLNLQTNWTYEHTLGMELTHIQGTYCTTFCSPAITHFSQCLLVPFFLLCRVSSKACLPRSSRLLFEATRTE